jgi:hypothetical protein
MKHLCRRSESQSFAGALIQSVFDHLNFLVRNACHLALLGHVLPQQAIEVLVGATLPARKGPGKVPMLPNTLSILACPLNYLPLS